MLPEVIRYQLAFSHSRPLVLQTITFCHFFVTGRLPQYFDDALHFRPERWLGNARRQIHPFAILPFGYGNRMCAGRRFSELELYISTAKVIHTFQLEALNPSIDLTHAFIVIPGHPIELKITARKTESVDDLEKDGRSEEMAMSGGIRLRTVHQL